MNAENLQRAIYSALTSDVDLMALVTGVYAQQEQGDDSESPLVFPYVIIGDDDFDDASTKDTNGTQATAIIHVWSRERNYLVNKSVADAVYNVLQHQPLTIVGANHIDTVIVGQTFEKDPDGVTKHGVMNAQIMYFQE